MALPTLAKSWQFSVNTNMPDQGAIAANAQFIMRKLKDLLIGTGIGGWTDSNGTGLGSPIGNWSVIGSSDGTTFGIDAVDRWSSDVKLVWANTGTSHSWIVLQQTGISGTFQVCIDLNSTSGNPLVSFTASHTGFGAGAGGTNGSLTAAPTALNSTTTLANVLWGCATAGFGAASRLHVLRTTDGSSTRVIISRAGRSAGLIMFEKVANIQAGWATPYVLYVAGDGAVTPATDVGTVSALFAAAGARAFGASAFAPFFTVQAPSGVAQFPLSAQLGANSFSAGYPMFPIGLYSTVAANIGPLGALTDIWGGLAALTNGTTYPNTTSPQKQFVQFSALIHPWNQTIPVLT